nr:LysR family transcriptional regulator [uncultured Holophaga sp.]
MLLNLSLTQLRYFLAVADCLSYTEAARRLNISQPPLSKQVAHLEAELGVQLFRREHRGVSLTPPGAVFAEDVRAFFAQLEGAVLRSRDLSAGGEGCLRLALPQAMVLDGLLNLIRRFTVAHPGIRFQVERHDLKQAREALLTGAADLLMTLGFEQGSLPGCAWRLLAERPGCWIVSRDHPLASREGLDSSDLEGLDLIIHDRELSPGGHEMALRTCRELGFSPRRLREASSFDSALTYVELGYGVMIVGRPLADLNADRFKAFDLPPGCGVGLLLAWKEGNPNPCLGTFLASFPPSCGAS